MKHTYEWFQQQARENRQSLGNWPEWMRTGPAFAAATFPTVRGSHSTDAKPAQVQGTALRRKQ